MGSSFKILVVGCGELGSRHLQAVSVLPNVDTIHIVDPDPKALETGRQRLLDVAERRKEIEFRWVSSLEEVRGDFDLCIVATLARERERLIKTLGQRLGIKKFLIEKIVSQSVRGYEALLEFSIDNALAVWVNCNTRGYPIHQYVRQKIKPEEPILFSSIGGNHGLASNGIHTSDLFLFYDGSNAIEGVASAVDPMIHTSKRGKNYFDLSGTLQGHTKKGSHFFLSFAKDHMASEQISIVTKNYRCVVDHILRWAVENEGEKSREWRPIPFEGNIFVSHTTRQFVHDILTKNRCDLPTLQECYPAHRYILDQLNPHFNHLLNKKDDQCPVT